MEIKEWASLPTGGHLHCVTIMRHCRATSVFYLKHKTERKRENETVKDGERDLMREHEEMERWLGSHCYWAKRWVALGERNENISIAPSSPSFLSRPPFPCSHLLISSHPFPFLIIISPPSSFLHLSCIFNMYSSVNRSVMSQNCKLPHLPPPSFPPPITSLPPTSVLASHILSTVSLFVLYLLVKFFLPVPPARLLHPHLLAPSVLWLTVFAWLCDL